MPTWTINQEAVTAAEVEAAMWDYARELGHRVWGRPATEAELRHAMAQDPNNDLTPPRGTFLVARSDGDEILGYVGVRLLPADPTTAEVKRMYVRPAGRGAGLGRGLLAAAEASARELGAARIVLETNTRLTEARALYLTHGYAETAPYNDHGTAEHWYAKAL